MTDNEIKTNYLEVYTDISRLKDNFKNVQNPINDVVGKFFGTALVADMTLADINEFINKHAHSASVVNNFFGVPVTSTTTTLRDITSYIARHSPIVNLANKFFGRVVAPELHMTGPSLAEIKSAIDEQKLTREIIDKFFEGSKPQDITTTFSYIDRYIKNQDQLGIRSLLVPFFFNRDGRIIRTDEIKANYLDIYNDISNPKENFEKVKIPNRVDIKNIVYTVAHGTMNWIRDERYSLIVNGWGDGEGGTDIYKLTWASKDQFDMIYNGKTYSGNIAILAIDNLIHNFTFLAVNDTIRSDIIWCLEFVADGK